MNRILVVYIVHCIIICNFLSIPFQHLLVQPQPTESLSEKDRNIKYSSKSVHSRHTCTVLQYSIVQSPNTHTLWLYVTYTDNNNNDLIYLKGDVSEYLFVSLHRPAGTQSTHIHPWWSGLAWQVYSGDSRVEHRALRTQYLHFRFTFMTCHVRQHEVLYLHTDTYLHNQNIFRIVHWLFRCEVSISPYCSLDGNSSSSRKSYKNKQFYSDIPNPKFVQLRSTQAGWGKVKLIINEL